MIANGEKMKNEKRIHALGLIRWPKCGTAHLQYVPAASNCPDRLQCCGWKLQWAEPGATSPRPSDRGLDWLQVVQIKHTRLDTRSPSPQLLSESIFGAAAQGPDAPAVPCVVGWKTRANGSEADTCRHPKPLDRVGRLGVLAMCGCPCRDVGTEEPQAHGHT